MIELLIVIIIIAILIGLLLPAINAAIRTAKNGAVSAEISMLSQAIESFKTRYGAYPPSRVILYENGLFNVNSTVVIPGENITEGALAQQSIAALRSFFPTVTLSTSGVPAPVLNGQGNYWYDFNGNGVFDQGSYILHGHECLVFFLGGIPLPNTQSSPPTFGVTGFGSDPTNPFTNSIIGSKMYNANRQPPTFEFNPGRLFLDPNNNAVSGLLPAGVPGYYDSLGNSPPSNGAGLTLNFYAYFSISGGGVYNADDVNFVSEADNNGLAPVGLTFQRGIAPYVSPAPNPYTSSVTSTITMDGTPTGAPNVTFQKAQTFQIIAAGIDGQYGIGGQFVAPGSAQSTASNPLPFDPGPQPPAHPMVFAGTSLAAETDTTLRYRETDNLTNFKSGTLQ
jgi:general secretion pathway protein G